MNSNIIPKAIIVLTLSIPTLMISLIVNDLVLTKVAFADSQALEHNKAGYHQSEKGTFSMSEKADITLNGVNCAQSSSSGSCQPPPGDGGSGGDSS